MNTTLTRFNPFRSLGIDNAQLRAMENEMDKLFNWPAGNGGQKEIMSVAQWAPAVDITEDDKEFLVKAELPEIKKEDVKVTVESGDLIISGERRAEKEEKGKKFHRVERSYGSFMRRFTLPEGVDPTKVAADFKDGLLAVHLPKSEAAKPKAVEVKVS